MTHPQAGEHKGALVLDSEMADTYRNYRSGRCGDPISLETWPNIIQRL